MGKDYQKQQQDICRYIFNDYIYDKDYSTSDRVFKSIDMLVENNLASKITGSESIYSSVATSRYKIACKFLCKYDKKLKRFKRRDLPNDNDVNFIVAGTDKRVTELNEYAFDNGVYYVNLGNKENDDYAIFRVDQDGDNDYRIKFELFFIGYRHSKFKDKYFKLVDKYEKMNKSQAETYIRYSDRRPPKNVIFKSFDDMVIRDKESIIRYIDNWLENIPKYNKYNITPKLSILLYGEPGTGKSTFSRALAKYLDIDSCTSINPEYFSSSNTNKGLNTYYPTVFTIDDIDCVCEARTENKSKENNSTLSSLLEFLDNPETFYYKAKDGLHYPISIVVASTNYIDKLDPAVKRHGRFDLKIEMGKFNKEEAEEMCNLYDLTLSDVYDGKVGKDFSISPSHLQALCLENIDSSLKAID